MDELILTADTSEVEQALAQLAQLPLERQELFFNLLDAGTEFIRIGLESRPASGTGEMRVRFQPTDLFRDFLAASRAGDGQVKVIE